MGFFKKYRHKNNSAQNNTNTVAGTTYVTPTVTAAAYPINSSAAPAQRQLQSEEYKSNQLVHQQQQQHQN